MMSKKAWYFLFSAILFFIWVRCLFESNFSGVGSSEWQPFVHEHDVGLVSTNTTQVFNLVVPVRARSAVRPAKVETSCSCLKAQVEKRWYQPGESIPVRIFLKTMDQAAIMRQRLRIRFDDDSAVCMVTVRANVKPVMHLSQDRLSIGADLSRSSTNATFTIANYGSREWEAVGAETDASWISAICNRISCKELPDDVAALQCWKCTLTVNTSELEPSVYKFTVRIRDSNNENSVELPLEVNVHPEIVGYPSSWYFFDIGSRKSEQRAKVVLRANAVGDMQRLDAKISDSLQGKLDVEVIQSAGSDLDYELIGRLTGEAVLEETKGTVELSHFVNERVRTVVIPVLLVP
jgi:hypothetical protein